MLPSLPQVEFEAPKDYKEPQRAPPPPPPVQQPASAAADGAAAGTAAGEEEEDAGPKFTAFLGRKKDG